ncbi:hypothetical protein GBA52_016093 [Prunus armeniaca]|nr:hypothetical protein GBA52_016093 [Prunus armeniaca]
MEDTLLTSQGQTNTIWNQNAHHSILQQLNLLSIAMPPELRDWTKMAETYDNLTNSVRIAMVGKYVGFTDSYLSVVKALLHACVACSLKPSIDWIAASDLEDDSAKLTPEAHAAAWETLKEVFPGISTICCTITRSMWMNGIGIDMRLVVNPDVIGILEEAGLKFVGKDDSGRRMEILELPSHPFYVGVQFHPEFKSRPGKPSALFLGLILAATGQLETYLDQHPNTS